MITCYLEQPVVRNRRVFACYDWAGPIWLSFAIVCATFPNFAAAFEVSTRCEAEQIDPSALIGPWDVSLYYAKDAPPSSTVMEVKKVTDGTVKGSFYGSKFQMARAISFECGVRMIGITEDGTGGYIHSARMIEPDRLTGQTLSTGRDFLMAWTAVREHGGKE